MKKFKKIYIEITNRCNLACSFCEPGKRPKAFMQLAAFEEILRKISGNTEYISLHVLGEALLHPELEPFLAMSREYGLRVNLSTNGMLLSRHREMLLRQPALRQINISLHSFEQSGDAALDAYLAGIFDFIVAAVPATQLFINLRLWNQQQDSAPGKQDTGSLVLQRLENHFGMPVPLAEDFSTGRGIILAPQVFLSRARRFTWPHAPAPEPGAHGYCRGLRDHIAILVDGTVVPCCLDAEGDIPLGNIFQAALDEILADPRAVMIREGFARQRLEDPLCRRCTYRQRFQRNIPVQQVQERVKGMSKKLMKRQRVAS
ncbi:MAG: SPASM domain-containing protein [Proteobacteria bacterium]|nr:SPASM domain-containing protein [Pseudomonadota bacterium]MBU1710617.1 SPASM domain-containing protein [Pseudomonadota bacterium]